jgi:glutamine cyclotransferase
VSPPLDRRRSCTRWLCQNGTRLVRSNGTGLLSFHDTLTFAPTGSVTVTLDGAPVDGLDTLTCVAGQVYATVARTARILRIDPGSGTVTAVVDTAGLIDDVPTGIAHLRGEEFLITGAGWPTAIRVLLTS